MLCLSVRYCYEVASEEMLPFILFHYFLFLSSSLPQACTLILAQYLLST